MYVERERERDRCVKLYKFEVSVMAILLPISVDLGCFPPFS